MATQISTASAFHVAVLCMYLVTLYYDWIYVEIGHREYAGKFKYLTFWNLVSISFLIAGEIRILLVKAISQVEKNCIGHLFR